MKYILFFTFFTQYFLSNASVEPEVVLTTGHNDQVNCMVVSSDNKYLASAGNNKIIKIWDIKSSREYITISDMDGRIDQLAFSSDNVSLAGTTSNHELFIWDIKTGKSQFETKSGTGTYGLSFYNEGKNLLFINDNNQLASLDVSTSKEDILIEDMYVTGFVIDKVKNISYFTNMKGKMIYFDLSSKIILNTYDYTDGFLFSFSALKISKNGRYIVNSFVDQKIRVFDTQLNKVTFLSKKYKESIYTFEMDAIEPVVFFTLQSGEVIFYNYKENKKIHSFKDKSFQVNCMSTYPGGGVLIVANYNLIRFIDTKSKKVFKKFEPKANQILNIAYDQQGKYLAVASDKVNIQIWDLRLNKIVKTLQGFFPCEFSPDGQSLVTMAYSTNMAVWNVSNWKKKKEYNTNHELIQKISFSNDGKFIAGSGYSQTIKVWDRTTGELYKTLKGHKGGVLAIDFHPTKPILASGGHDGTVRIWNYKTGQELQQFNEQTIVISDVKFSPDGQTLASSAWDKTIYMRSVTDWKVIKILEKHTNAVMGIDYNKTGNVLVSFSGNNSVDEADNSLIFWNVNDGSVITQIKHHKSGITKAFFDLDADRVFSSSNDGTVKITDYKSNSNVVTYVSIGAEDFMVYTPDNYYMASQNALQSIAFRIGSDLVPFEQFDIYLNRPDIIAKVVGKSPTQLIKAFNYLYKKRLKKYGFEEGSLKLDYHLPNILNETNIPILTTESTVKATIKCWDNKYNLKQINVYVNGTPVYGEKGLLIKKDIKSYRTTIEVPLLDGKNFVRISCLNSNGVESIYESFEIFKEETITNKDLYVVTIGVSNYKDGRFNLKYPTKDAKNMLEKLSSVKGLYKNVYKKTLLNEEVTIDNVAELKTFFKDCKYNDVAIIFIAGHGVLDANFDYFFGTYDMDFDNPKNGGLAYDNLQQLLATIKAYRKLLIMDTCHSGELDKEEIEAGPEPEVDDSDIEFRAGGVNVREKEGMGFENSLEYTKNLFTDTRKGTGVIVISSAGGAEYAMESDQWQNGLFTYSFLLGFEEDWDTFAKADFDKNGKVEVSEIRKFVNLKVTEASGGKQIPSSREDNILLDYSIFRQ